MLREPMLRLGEQVGQDNKLLNKKACSILQAFFCFKIILLTKITDFHVCSFTVTILPLE